MSPLLEVTDLHVTFRPPVGDVHAVRGLDLVLEQGRVLGVVGESGCGKSAAFRALLGLAPASAEVTGDVSAQLPGGHVQGSPADAAAALQQASAMIYQNPGAALNPVFTIGRQLSMVAGVDERAELAAMLGRVGLPEPEVALKAYPHEFSGGMRQRAVIAMALAKNPALLIADEPTTALDVTTQAQILALFRELVAEHELTVVFISHDLAVVERVADDIAVLYAGTVVENGPVAEVLAHPQHPYTQALVRSIPSANAVGGDLETIAGSVPDGRDPIVGCAFAPRCPHVYDACTSASPNLRPADSGRRVACVLVAENASEEARS